MANIAIKDLDHSAELDHQAMLALRGTGIWGSIKKGVKKGARYIKRKVKERIAVGREIYRVSRGVPRTLYYGVRGWF